MKTKYWIILVALLFGGWASSQDSLAGVFVVIAWAAITWHLHVIEAKLNKLLDFHELRIGKDELD